MDDIIMAALAALPGEEASAEEAPETDAPAENEADAAEAPAEEAPAEEPTEEAPEEADPEALFSEEALKTPEGIVAAKAEVERRISDARKREFRLNKKAAKLSAQVRQFAAERDTVRLTAQQIQGAVSGLQRGGAKDVLHALGQLTNRDPVTLFEELSLYVARNGKMPASAEPTAADKRIAELEARIAAREEHEELQKETAKLEANIQGHRQSIGQLAASEEQFPRVAALVTTGAEEQAEIVTWVIDRITAAYEQGRSVTPQEALAALENRLSAIADKSGAKRPAPRQAARTVTNTSASAPAKQREATPDIRQFHQDIGLLY